MPAVALAAGCIVTTNWTGAVDNNWFTCTNWDNRCPDSSKNAYINNAGTADVNSAGAVACNLTLGVDVVQSGKVSVAGGSLAVTNEVEVGSLGRGTLSLTNGGTVSAGLLTIAAQANSASNGTVTVDGGTFTVNTRADVGGDNGAPGGIALMTVKNGGGLTAGNLHLYKSAEVSGRPVVHTKDGVQLIIDLNDHTRAQLC